MRSTGRVFLFLYRVCSLSDWFSIISDPISGPAPQNVLGAEQVACLKMSPLSNVFSIECVLYAVCVCVYVCVCMCVCVCVCVYVCVFSIEFAAERERARERAVG